MTRRWQSYDRFLATCARPGRAWNSRGLALQNLGRLDEALQSYRRAEALDPELAAARLNRGLCHLLMQDFAQGLPLYEWRKHMPQPMEARRLCPAAMDGRARISAGKILFAYVEQGLGDTIQFYRYVSFALARGARVILSVPDRLMALLKNATPAVELIGSGPDAGAVRFSYSAGQHSAGGGHAGRHHSRVGPLSDRRTGSRGALEIAAGQPRLSHRHRLAGQGRRSGGWKENPFRLRRWQKSRALPDVRLISLQKGEGVEQLQHLPPGMTVETYEFDEGPDAFLDTAAMMQACDLVITADTAPAHLAGALGVPAWVALKHVPDWRWFLGRDDSPWYPSLRLFRQPATGDWDSVFNAIAAQLAVRPAKS